MWERKEREPLPKWKKTKQWNVEMEKKKEGKQRDGSGGEKLQQRLDIK